MRECALSHEIFTYDAILMTFQDIFSSFSDSNKEPIILY